MYERRAHRSPRKAVPARRRVRVDIADAGVFLGGDRGDHAGAGEDHEPQARHLPNGQSLRLYRKNMKRTKCDAHSKHRDDKKTAKKKKSLHD